MEETMPEEKICEVCQGAIEDNDDIAECRECGSEFHYPDCGNSYNYGEICDNCAKHD